jgi:hypothetical protein
LYLFEDSFFITKLIKPSPKDFSIRLYINYGFANYLGYHFKIIPAIFLAGSDEIIEI